MELNFVEIPRSRSPRITRVWTVMNTAKHPLGSIHWRPTWRRYVFTAGGYCTFDADCLRQIQSFLEYMTKEQQVLAKARREAARS